MGKDKFIKRELKDAVNLLATATPSETADKRGMVEIQDELNKQDIPLGKRHRMTGQRKVSCVDAVNMHYCGDRDLEKVGAKAKEFLTDANYDLSAQLTNMQS